MKHITYDGCWNIYLYCEHDGDSSIEFDDLHQAKEFLHRTFNNVASKEILDSFRDILREEDHVNDTSLSNEEILDHMAEKMVKEELVLYKDRIPWDERPSIPVTAEKKPIPIISSDDVPQNWVEILIKDQRGKPIFGEGYKITSESGITYGKGVTTSKGWARAEDIEARKCKIIFPNQTKKQAQEERQANMPNAQIRYDFKIDPGRKYQFTVETGKLWTFFLEDFGDIVLRLDVDPNDIDTYDDVFTLISTDGSYKETRTIKDDIKRGDDYLDLYFGNLDKSLLYTLTVDLGEDEGIQKIFEAIPFADLLDRSENE